MTQPLRATGLRALLSCLLAAAVIAGAGCSPADGHRPALPPAASASPTEASGKPLVAQTKAAQTTVSALLTAARAGDRVSWDRQVSVVDPAFVPRSEMIFANLTELKPRTLTATMTNARGTLDIDRRTVLGRGAWLGEATIEWSVGDETRKAVNTVWLTFVPAGDGQRLAGTTDLPAGQPVDATPLWLLEPIKRVTDGPVTLVAARTVQADGWAARAAAAAAAVRRGVDGLVGPHWSGRVVVEMPGGRTSFEQLLGVPSGSYDRIAAVAWPEGPEPKRAPVRVIINPTSASRLASSARDIVLSHEIVHVATDSPSSEAPLWVVEGYADLIAFQHQPVAAKAAQKSLLASIRKHGPPSALPADANFDPASASLDDSYTLSWLACRYLVQHWSAAAMNAFYAALEGTDAGEVDAALRHVLGTDRATFLRGWGDYLRQTARNGH